MILRVSHFIFGLLRRSQAKKSGVKGLNRELTVAGFGVMVKSNAFSP